jgi:hypothetical protein
MQARSCPGASIGAIGSSIAVVCSFSSTPLHQKAALLSFKQQVQYLRLLLSFSGVIGRCCANPIATVGLELM